MQGSRGISLYKKDSPGELFRFPLKRFSAEQRKALYISRLQCR